MQTAILRVAVLNPLPQLFDYLPPIGSMPPFLTGVRVRIPFGTRELIAICIAVCERSDVPSHKLKNAIEILDQEPIFTATLFKLIDWAHQYYHCSLGEVLETALPAYLRQGKSFDETILKVPIKKRKSALKVLNELPLPESDLQSSACTLNNAQLQAIKAVTNTLGSFSTFLLDGVTGSGKTEVYLQLIQTVLDQHKQALVLIPEIGLTPQTLARFKARFKTTIVVINSGISEKARFKAWLQARNGQAGIIIGTRSASFTPLKAPGIFIIDEEHDLSFKQQTGFRYSARDLLIRRAQLENCVIVLGTATPSLETLYNVQLSKYQHLKLPFRAGLAKLPAIQILDVRHKKLDEGLSSQLLASMQAHLSSGNQVLLFLNRRGFAPVLCCAKCDWIGQCSRCDARLTLHFSPPRLQCHHCDSRKTIPLICPTCGSEHLNPVGLGTERLEKALAEHFPAILIQRIDRDTTRRQGTLNAMIENVHQGTPQILVGTQMLAKGHHFPDVTLVAILDIDGAFYGLDFRNIERLGQLITQVSGRAGRANKAGQVLLQTTHPEHPLLKLLLEKGYYALTQMLLHERKQANLPPYSYQALFRAEAKKNEYVFEFLHYIKKIIPLNQAPLQVLGPVPSPMARRIGYHRAQLLLQTTDRNALHRALKALMPHIKAYPQKHRIRWSLDIDPLEVT